MFLSIVIPIYNDEKYLAECLDSCLTQDIPYDDYEIICVDDGSTDRTPEILEDYAKRYPNVVLVFKEHGVGFGRTIGMERAKGEYIWFVDHDDLLAENVLATLKEEAGKSKSDRIIFSCYAFWNELSTEEKRGKAEKTLTPNSDLRINYVVWASIIGKAFLIENDVFPRSKRMEGKKGWSIDALLIYEIKQHDATESDITGVPFYYYRMHRGSETANNSQAAIDARFFGWANIAALIHQDYYESLGKNPAHCANAATYLTRFLTACTGALFKCPPEEYREKKKYLVDNGLFPLKAPKKSRELREQFLIEHPGNRKIHRILRYYSIYSEAALIALALPYRVEWFKISLSRLMRRNKLLNKLLDMKNKLLGR